jgi:hypothetical protein
MPTRMALAENDLDHLDRTVADLRADHEELVDRVDTDDKSRRTAFYALIGTILTPLLTGLFGLIFLLVK